MFNFARRKSTSVSNAMSIVELMVHMDCEGCERRVRKAISKLDGVDEVEIDMEMQKVTVTGYVDEKAVLKAVRRRTGRKAELWPYPYDADYQFAFQYLDDDDDDTTHNHNYYRHGYNVSALHGYFPDPAYTVLLDDHAAALFNDDNVHACSII